MMTSPRSAFRKIPPPSESFWLTRHHSEFAETLVEQGYYWRNVYNYRLMSGRLCAQAEARGLGPDALNPEVMDDLARACPGDVAVSTKSTMAMVARRFAGYLVDAGVIEPVVPPPPDPGSPEGLCEELEHWLRHHKGMYGKCRLRANRNLLKQLMAYWCTSTGTADDLSSLTAEDVFAFLDHSPGKPGWKAEGLRNTLRFLFWNGRIPHDLSAAVPGNPARQPDGRPRHLEPEAIRKLLEAIRNADGRSGLRNYAMFLLMARLGLRAQEVVAMRLDDIDWRAGRVTIRGKAEQLDHMPLPVDVGEAIVDWLRNGRKGDSRYLFVSVVAPYLPLTGTHTLLWVLHRAYRETGLTPPHGKVQTHAFRHSLAMRLVGEGASLEEIGDVLRHRWLLSTTVYARHDVDSLRPLARPWPVAGGAR